MTFLGLVVAAPAIGADTPGATIPPGLSPGDLNIAAGVAQANDQLQRWRSPAAQAARRRSRTDFHGLSGSAALQTAQTAFPQEFRARLFDGSQPNAGQQVVKRLSPTEAVTETPSGQRTVLQSSLPLETENTTGQQAAVDLSLVQDTAGYHTRNSLVDLSIAKRSGAGVSFPGAGFSVAPGGPSDATATESDGRAFYANTQTDADFMVAPSPTGAELGWQLRSAESPEQLTLHVDLPGGAVLRRAETDHPIPGDPPSSFAIVKGGENLAYIYPPNTYDADGVPVPSSAKLDGDSIVISVKHRDGDYHYPLFVDPVVSANDSGASGWAGWGTVAFPNNTTPNTKNYFGASANNCTYSCGLYLSMPTNTNYSPSGSFIWWQYRALANTYIYAATLGGMAHSPSMPYAYAGSAYTTYPWIFSRWFNGLENGTFTGWEANTDYINQSGAYGGNPFGPTWNGAGGVTHAYCLEPPAGSGRVRCDRRNLAASDTNAVILGLSAQNDVKPTVDFSTGTSKATVTADWANVYLTDRYDPNMSSTTPTSRGWSDDSASPVHSVTVSAHDQGLGVGGITLSGASTGNGTQQPVCSGHPQRSPCPADWSTSFGYRLNEGLNTLHVQPVDIVDRTGPTQTWTEMIDRTPPSVSLSGSLSTADGTSLTAGQSYTLNVNATDTGAGVKDATILFDGDQDWTASQVCGSAGGCSMAHTYSISADGLSAGEHTVTVQSHDMLDHPATEQTITFSAPGSPPPDDDPGAPDEETLSPATPVATSPTGPVASGTYTTSLWSDAETNTAEGVNVISSTSPGTVALTGTVVDADSQDPLAGATVTLACPSCGSASVSTSTTTDGAYAFVNMPSGVYTLTVVASGHAAYSITQDTYEPDHTYYHQATVSTTGAQTIDASITPDDNQGVDLIDGPIVTNRYPSVSRVPPVIRVGFVQTDHLCNRTVDTPNAPVVQYAWAYYVLHVLFREVNIVHYNQAAMQAFEGIVSNYAWYHTLLPRSERYDVDNSTAFQCFEPNAKVDDKWRDWLGDVLKYRYVTDSPPANKPPILETTFVNGEDNGKCNDPAFPPDKNHAGQYNLGTLSTSCGSAYNNWQGIVNYVIGGSIRPADPPPSPTVSGSSASGGVHLQFKSGSSRNLGWSYEIQRLGTTGSWVTIYNRGWKQSIHDIPTDVTYHTALTQSYRIRAWSPAGNTSYVSVNGGTAIAPG